MRLSPTLCSRCLWGARGHHFGMGNRTWKMKLLSDHDRTFWHENGYVVIPDVVPAANLTAVIDAIAEFTGKNLADRECWYQDRWSTVEWST